MSLQFTDGTLFVKKDHTENGTADYAIVIGDKIRFFNQAQRWEHEVESISRYAPWMDSYLIFSPTGALL